MEPPIGIEPMTYALREAWWHATRALPAQIAQSGARMTLSTLDFCRCPFHETFHAALR